MDSIKLLAKWGDPLEKAIVRSSQESLSVFLQPYADIWARHVFPRRDESGSRVSANWMDFAGSHYTALIRVLHASEALQDLKTHCEAELASEYGDQLLQIQRHAASYWWNVGSAIDNLGAAYSDAACTNLAKGSGSKKLKRDHVVLSQAYDRRTQFIHSRIVPIGVDGGIPFFHFKFLASDLESEGDLAKYTDWTMEYQGRQEILMDFYEESWRRLQTEMHTAWCQLRKWLRETDNDPAIARELDSAQKAKESIIDVRNDGYEPPSNIRTTGHENGGFVAPSG